MNSAIDLSSNPFRREAVSREIKHVVKALSRTKAPVVFGGAPHSLTRKALEAAGHVVTVLGDSWRVEGGA